MCFSLRVFEENTCFCFFTIFSKRSFSSQGGMFSFSKFFSSVRFDFMSNVFVFIY